MNNINTPSFRKSAIASGVLFLITHVTAIGAFFLYDPVLKNPHYIIEIHSDAQVILGALFDVILALAVIGTSVALFPIVKHWNEGIALGYVGLRTLEAAIIAIGVVPLLAIVTLHQHQLLTDGADDLALIKLGEALLSFHNWTLILGPGLVCGTNTVLMAYLMYTSRLVPRFIPILGLVGGPVIFAYSTIKMFDIQMPLWTEIVVIPIFAWELSLAIYLITRGFKRSTIDSQSEQIASNQMFVTA